MKYKKFSLGAYAEWAQRIHCWVRNGLPVRDGKTDCGIALGVPGEKEEHGLDVDLGSTLST